MAFLQKALSFLCRGALMRDRVAEAESRHLGAGLGEQILELRAEHIAGARLFANRADALAALPTGGNVAEIGVAFGDFSEVLLDRLMPKRFDAYDLFRLHHAETLWGRPSAEVFNGMTHRQFYEHRFAKQFQSRQLRIFEGDSPFELGKQADECYDVIYIDGDHSYNGVRRDAEISSKKLRRDGLLVFNDYIMEDHLQRSPYGIVPVVNEFCVNRGWKVVYFALQVQMFCDICIRRGL